MLDHLLKSFAGYELVMLVSLDYREHNNSMLNNIRTRVD